MTVLGKNYFGLIDYATVSLTLLISLGIGIYHAIKGGGKRNSEDLLVGGRKMSTVPVAISILVTFLSAVTVIGDPSEIYTNGVQFFWMAFLLTFPIMPLSLYIYMPVFYKLKLTSVCEYFEYRFDSALVRCLASGILLVQFSFLAGVTLYAPAIALEAFMGLPIWISVFGIGLCGTLYTCFGGFKAVIWTDVFQFCLILIGMVAILIRGFITAGGVYEAFSIASTNRRLELFNWNVDPFEKYNTFNFIFGYGLILLNFYGTNQLMVQRYSSVPTLEKAIQTVAIAASLRQLSFLLIICTGVAIFATYAGCDPILLGEIQKADQIVPYFFIKELSSIPGMMGLFTSCVFSAVLSTISSSLNSSAAITWKDFVSRIPYFDALSPIAKGRMTMVLGAVYGLMAMGIAVVVGRLGSIFQLVWIIIGAFNGAIGGCFLMGMFIPMVNKVGVFLGMGVSILSTGFLSYQTYVRRIPTTSLATNIYSCPSGTDFSLATNMTVEHSSIQQDWPEKIFTLSTLLYSTIGTLIAIFVGCTASLISKCFVQEQPASCHEYLHPIVKNYLRKNRKTSWICPECAELTENNGVRPISSGFELKLNLYNRAGLPNKQCEACLANASL